MPTKMQKCSPLNPITPGLSVRTFVFATYFTWRCEDACIFSWACSGLLQSSPLIHFQVNPTSDCLTAPQNRYTAGRNRIKVYFVYVIFCNNIVYYILSIHNLSKIVFINSSIRILDMYSLNTNLYQRQMETSWEKSYWGNKK